MNKPREISAKIIADSKAPSGARLTTFVVTFPRIVLAEFNTHRALSKNSASSRAIPFRKMLEMVMEDPFIPIGWMKDHTGMQGTEYVTEPHLAEAMRNRWLEARNNAVEQADALSTLGLTKQICNRLLEPFMWHTVIVTGTEWENFFALRAHPAAEIHIAALAHCMLDEYNKSVPKELSEGEWHIPFGDRFDEERVIDLACDLVGNEINDEHELADIVERTKVKIATARCARVSYMNFDGTDDYEKDVQLHDRLAEMGHWSPFEHCAMAMYFDEEGMRWSGNFKGFRQYRKGFGEENRMDHRVISK